MTYDYFELLKCSNFIQTKKEEAKLFSYTITSGLFVSNARFPLTFSHRRQLRIPLQAQKTSSLPSWEIIFYFRVFLFFCCNVYVIFNIRLKKESADASSPPSGLEYDLSALISRWSRRSCAESFDTHSPTFSVLSLRCVRIIKFIHMVVFFSMFRRIFSWDTQLRVL